MKNELQREKGLEKVRKSLYQRIRTHWNLYKITNLSKPFLLIRYVFIVWVYRKFFCYLLALPLFLVYLILFPFIKLRFIRLIGGSIGHYTMNTECVVSELELLEEDKFFNIFYLEHSLLEPSICNAQLHKMWKRILFILPLNASSVVAILDKLLMYFFASKAYGLQGKKAFLENRGGRDIYNYLKKMPIHLSFTEEEHAIAHQLLEKINIKSTDRYVCLLVRSSAYNKNHPTWNKPERNAELSTER